MDRGEAEQRRAVVGSKEGLGGSEHEEGIFGSGRIPMRKRQEEWRRSGGSLEIRDLV